MNNEQKPKITISYEFGRLVHKIHQAGSMTVTQDEFFEKLKEIGVSFYTKTDEDDRSYYRRKDFEPVSLKKRKKPIPFEELYFYKEWRTGGQSGGSYWDEGEPSHYSVEGEPEPEFGDLDTVLENVCPNITFLNYRKFTKLLKIIEGTWVENEYYGNYSNYAFKVIKLTDLYDALKEIKAF